MMTNLYVTFYVNLLLYFIYYKKGLHLLSWLKLSLTFSMLSNIKETKKKASTCQYNNSLKDTLLHLVPLDFFRLFIHVYKHIQIPSVLSFFSLSLSL